MLSAPPGLGFAPCSAAPGTNEVHTELRKLNMVALACNGSSGRPAVRAGTAYTAPMKVSPGEVESHAAPGGSPDFPASSFFDMFVQVDLPACGKLPASTVQNNLPFIVKNNDLTAFPPRVIYIHDQSSSVPVIFVPGGPFAGQSLGYLVLAGHAASFTCSQSDQDEFNNFMASQPIAPVPVTPVLRLQVKVGVQSRAEPESSERTGNLHFARGWRQAYWYHAQMIVPDR